MEVVFTKQENCSYSILVTRSDHVKLQFQGVGKKFLIPHDLSHFIVESKLNMRQGFWGCVAKGALFSGMNIVEGRQKAHARSRSKQVIKESSQQLRLAECLVRVFDQISVDELDRVKASATKHLSQISSDIKPNELSDSTIMNIYSTFRAFQNNWQRIDEGENIEISWNEKFPYKSLNILL